MSDKTESLDVLEAEDEAQDAPEAKAPEAPAPRLPEDPTALANMGVAVLLDKIGDMERRLEEKEAVEDLGPPPLRRSKRRHILVWVNPYNLVRREVPEDYDGPGLDGKPVKAYQNHRRSALKGDR